MSYLIKQQIKLSDLVDLAGDLKLVLVAEPEDCLYGIYARHLREHRFVVHRCDGLDRVPDRLREHCPHLLVLSLEFDGGVRSAVRLLRRLKEEFPELHVVTVSTAAGADDLKVLMSAGVSSHIDRKFSRPQDVAVVAKTVLCL